MHKEHEERTKRNWAGVTIATLIGIIATVLVGWYQLSQAEKQAVLAEEERAKSVRQDLIAIIEEHVLNDKPINLSRLTRLIAQRRREEKVTIAITLNEILEKAEFNILNSRYLAFDKKEALKSVFDSLYSDLSARTFVPYKPNIPNADLLNELAIKIQDGKPTDALDALKRLQESYSKDIELASKIKQRNLAPSKIIHELINNPMSLLFVILLYAAMLMILIKRRHFLRILRERKEEIQEDNKEK